MRGRSIGPCSYSLATSHPCGSKEKALTQLPDMRKYELIRDRIRWVLCSIDQMTSQTKQLEVDSIESVRVIVHHIAKVNGA